MMNRKIDYDCDTYSYWCRKNEYTDKEKSFGKFSDDDKSYIIENPDTPRPWLNYLCNDNVASVVTNTGKGFFWYKSSLL
ncbi:MAG: hypothetical protein JXN10_02710, partial [Clostridia bacterium]|nr:hypothetical protein [Clostridia bacterium]